MSKYLILDGHSLAYRAYFALAGSGLLDDNGNETHAIHGFYSMFAKLLEEIKPAGVAMAFDRPEPTFRDKIDPHYKDGRPETPDSLIFQVEAIKEIALAFNILVLEYAGYEADDIIATVATKGAAEEKSIIVVTGDRDSFQLVQDPYIEVLYLMRGVSEYNIYNEEKIRERTGVFPEYYPTLASLRGDPSDNLPGVAGIGPKTAAKLINAYGSLDEIYAHLAELSPKQSEELLKSKERVYLNLKMTLAKRDVPLEFDFEDLLLGHENQPLLGQLFNNYKIRRTKERIFAILNTSYGSTPFRASDLSGIEETSQAKAVTTGSLPQVSDFGVDNLRGWDSISVINTIEVTDDEVILEHLNNLEAKTHLRMIFLAKDVFAGNNGLILSGLVVPEEKLVNLSSANEQFFKKHINDIAKAHPLFSYYIDDLAKDGWDPQDILILSPENLNNRLVREKLSTLLNEQNYCITYKTKEVIRFLLNYNLSLSNVIFDVSLAAYLIDPDTGAETIAGLADKFLEKEFRQTIGLGDQMGQLAFIAEGEGTPDLDADRELIRSYVCIIARLSDVLAGILKDVNGLVLLHEIEIPLALVLAKMEFYGIMVDKPKLEEILLELKKQLYMLEKNIFQFVDEPFNLNSPKQLGEVLYQKLGLVSAKKTKGKTSFSTDAATLEKLRYEHPIIEFILRYRELEKLRSTYAMGLIKEVQPDSRIHATFHQTVARTGRLSSDKPNLHNIPLRTEAGKEFREVFIADKGNLLLVADYNQIELRIVAHLAKDSGLIEAFAQNIDVHTATAAKVYGVGVDQVTPEMRQKAKMVSYGLIYGMEAYGLAQRLAIEVNEAKEILENYFAAFPDVKKYMKSAITSAKESGYTETLLGRRRYIRDLSSPIYAVRQAAERQAMNAGVQGLAADIFKIALVNLDRKISDLALSSHIVLQVHDEIILEVPLSEKDAVENYCLEEMRNAVSLDVPLEVNIGWGHSWADAKGK